MGVLMVPPADEVPWPTLGPQVCELLEDRAVHGPGDLKGQPYKLDADKRAFIYRAYEVFPRGHARAGKRRFKRFGLSLRKGTAKTELAAAIAFAELHPEAPVRCDGWHEVDGVWQPVGAPVVDPYIPMVAYTEEQTEDLAYAALYVMCSMGSDADFFDIGLDRIVRLSEDGRADGKAVVDPYIPMVAYTEEQTEDLAYAALYVMCSMGSDADFFDIGLDRIVRLSEDGRADGKAVALASSPDSRDGARTTFQHFDETHRFTLARLVEAHETMLQNIPKRMKADAWSLETTTTYTPGEGSVAQGSHEDAERIDRGEIKDSTFFFFHRDAAPRADENLDDPVELADAIREASGPSIAQWDDFEGQVDSIASLYHQAKRRGNESYFERVWLNRRVQGGNKAFDSTRWIELTVDRPPVPHKSAITLGLDGSKWNDTTALVATDVVTGWQWLAGFWDPSIMQSGEVPVDEVEAVCQSMFETFNVMRMNGDPAQGFDVVLSRLESKFGGRRVVQFYTDARGLRKTAFAAKRYSTAMRSGELTHSPDKVFAEHIGASVKRPLKMLDDEGQPMWLIEKERRDSPNKIDIAMAGLLSWDARMDALALGVPEPVSSKMIGF